MTKLILVRHGRTVWNDGLRYQGHLDIELSELGHVQARQTAACLKNITLDAAYTSDLRRCHDTAAAILADRAVPLAARSDLRETHYGQWQGLTYAEVRQRYPYILQMRVQDPIGYAAPGGETVGQMTARVCAAIEEIAAKHDGGSVLVVTHGGPLRAVVCDLLAVEPRRGWRIMVENCSVTVIEITAGQPDRSRLVLFNDVCHLHNGHAHPL